MAIDEFAPAKVNLALHVTGRRDDGYHLIDTLVVFADVGDRLRVAAAADLTLEISGPQAEGLAADESNLVLRAARLMGVTGAAMRLEKHLPLAAGLGGGSADAAASLRALARLTGRPFPDAAQTLALGADVPMCLAARPARATGTGGQLAPLPGLPPVRLVLVNPGVPVATAAVFSALGHARGAFGPPMPARLPDWPDAMSLADFLAAERNDLAVPAMALAPVIADALSALSAQPGCLLARMSGSGATCFGLFADPAASRAAAVAIGARHARWWVTDAGLWTRPED